MTQKKMKTVVITLKKKMDKFNEAKEILLKKIYQHEKDTLSYFNKLLFMEYLQEYLLNPLNKCNT